MKVIFNLAEKFAQPFISINAQRQDEDLITLSIAIDRLVNRMTIIGNDGNEQTVIPLYKVIRFYTRDKSVVCETSERVFRITERLYELREQLSDFDFIAISNSEIVNQTAIASFSLSKTGQYHINLTTGAVAYPSRRYLKQIKEAILK